MASIYAKRTSLILSKPLYRHLLFVLHPERITDDPAKYQRHMRLMQEFTALKAVTPEGEPLNQRDQPLKPKDAP